MEFTSFNLGIDQHIAHLVLNRPDKRNCMTETFWKELPEAVQYLATSTEDVRVLILSGEGPHFTSGIDLGMFGGIAQAISSGMDQGRVREALYRKILGLQDAFTALEEAPFPVLAAIQGGCIGGGIDMITACDMRYATKDAFFTVKEIDIGMAADVGTLQRIQSVMPAGLARELVYTGRNMDASEAMACGLVTRIFDDHNAILEGVMEIATTIAAKSPLAITGCKRNLNYARDHSVAQSLDYMAAWNAGMLINEDLQKSMMANMAKTTPEFDGKIMNF